MHEPGYGAQGRLLCSIAIPSLASARRAVICIVNFLTHNSFWRVSAEARIVESL